MQELALIQDKDGHIVKSKSEREIDNFLNQYKIRHYYEHELSIDDNPEHSIHPDFYLPDLDVYIEHWGKDKYYGDYPFIDNEVAEYIVEHKKKGVGLDTIGLDPIRDINLTLHKMLLKENETVG